MQIETFIHLDSHRRKKDGKSKFYLRVHIGKVRKLYPVDTKGTRPVFMDQKYWIPETITEECPETGKMILRELKTRRMAHVKSNPNSKQIQTILESKKKEMDDLIYMLTALGHTVTHTLLKARWGVKEGKSTYEYAVSWLERYADEKKLGENTIIRWRDLLRCIQEFEQLNGVIPMQQVGPDWILEFQKWLRRDKKTEGGVVYGKGFAASTTSKHMRNLGTIFTWAKSDGVIFDNPYREVSDKGLIKRAAQKEIRFLENEQVERMYEAFKNEELKGYIQIDARGRAFRQYGERYHGYLKMLLFTIYTGLRYGDIVKLSRRHPDIEIGKSHLTVVMDKTGRKVRLKITDRMREVANLSDPSRPVFDMKRMPTNGCASHILRRLLRILGIDKYVVFHDLRRTFACSLLSRGVRIKVVSLLLGHKSVETTEKHYARIINDDMDSGISAWDTSKPVNNTDQLKELKEAIDWIRANRDMVFPPLLVKWVTESCEALQVEVPKELKGKRMKVMSSKKVA